MITYHCRECKMEIGSGYCIEHPKAEIYSINSPDTEPDLDLDCYAGMVKSVHTQAARVNDAALDPVAEQQLAVALALIEQALAHLNLASLAQARGIAER